MNKNVNIIEQMTSESDLHYNISEILLKTCDISKLSQMFDTAETIEKQFTDIVGDCGNEYDYTIELNKNIRQSEVDLKRIKSKAWDELFSNNLNRSLSLDWLQLSLQRVLVSEVHVEMQNKTNEIDVLKCRRTEYIKMCTSLADLLIDYSHFEKRDGRDSLAPVINIDGIVKLSNPSIYDDIKHVSVLPIFETVAKVKERLLESLIELKREVIDTKAAAFDMVSCTL